MGFGQIEQIALRIAQPAVEMPLLKRLGAPDFIDARALFVGTNGTNL